MDTQTTRRVIGTRTGKVRHLQVQGVDSLPLGYTMCGGRKLANAVELRGMEATCQKCLDKADLEDGLPHHTLSITDTYHEASGRWAGVCGTCSCGTWQDTVLHSPDVHQSGGVGPTIVTHHYTHVIAAVRAARTTPEEG